MFRMNRRFRRLSNIYSSGLHLSRRLCSQFCLAAFLVSLVSVGFAPRLLAQSTPPTPPPTQQPDTASPDAGGPGGDNGPIVVPKKKATPEDADTPPPAPVAPKIRNPPNMPSVSLHVDVPEVTVDVGVLLEKTHQFVPNLKAANFRVFEDGKEQKVIGFKRTEAPITALLICEFAATNYQFIYDMRNAAFSFAQQLRPQDYVAMMTFDMRTQIVTDFTQDKRQILESINSLRIPGFSERNLFDALYEGLDRVSRIEGQKYIILIASGRDTFSKITLDKIMDKIRKTPDVTIFTVSTGAVARIMSEGRGRGGFGGAEMDYLQADNQMQTFARMTGGMFFAPRFVAEMPDDFNAINQAIRSKYELVYHPLNSAQDGTFRKLQVQLVDDEGHPLQIQDEKHKPLKYELIYRNGYRAHQEVE
ncbi:VWA domain-containing protein [Acidicapsa acidisoli]|uniref:VWA domain-containing protein n=1 Tax=Acidicapsa acidisoli TaxID=1615681 RepID=UPI0021E094B1|nr:VWA domain-containing protein [Acidicapsa acidisoli]